MLTAPPLPPPPLLLWRLFVCKHFLFSQAAKFDNSLRKFLYSDEVVNLMPKTPNMEDHVTTICLNSRWNSVILPATRLQPYTFRVHWYKQKHFSGKHMPSTSVGTIERVQKGFSNFIHKTSIINATFSVVLTHNINQHHSKLQTGRNMLHTYTIAFYEETANIFNELQNACIILVPHYRKLCQLHAWPASWSSGQSFWLLITRSRVRFPVPPWGFSLWEEDPRGDHGLGS